MREQTINGISYRCRNLPLQGACVIERIPYTDHRGTFDRVYDPALLASVAGYHLRVAQLALVQNPIAGTLRGLHFQTPPMQEAKLVTCLKGEILDVLLDLRMRSATWGKSTAVLLRAKDRRSVLVPPGFAHGYITLKEDSWVQYATDAPYSTLHAASLHWKCAGSAWGNWFNDGPAEISLRDSGAPHYLPSALPRIVVER